MAPPFKQAEFEILYGEGISWLGELIDLGVQHNLVEKSGSWYSYNGERIGQGKDNAREFLKEHPDMAKQLDTKLREILLPKRKPADASEAASEATEEAV